MCKINSEINSAQKQNLICALSKIQESMAAGKTVKANLKHVIAKLPAPAEALGAAEMGIREGEDKARRLSQHPEEK